MSARRCILFTLCFVGLTTIGFALPATVPAHSRGEETSREQQIKDVEKQLQELTVKVNDLKKENVKVAPAHSKVAVLNLSYVMKNCKKWDRFQSDYKGKIEAFDKKLRPLKDHLDEWSKELGKLDVTAVDEKAEIEKKSRKTQQTIQDLGEEFKKTLADFEGATLTSLYNDVKNMAKRYAKSKGIELVMHFNDGTTEEEANTAQNIGRKMGHGALFPIYVGPGMDIGDEILELLNGEKAADLK